MTKAKMRMIMHLQQLDAHFKLNFTAPNNVGALE